MTLVDTVILVAFFFIALFSCADAELWQRFVAASLVSLVWLGWLKIGGLR